MHGVAHGTHSGQGHVARGVSLPLGPVRMGPCQSLHTGGPAGCRMHMWAPRLAVRRYAGLAGGVRCPWSAD